MINDRMREALVFVLVQKIYPHELSLVRNDVKTAKLTRAFVLEIDREIQKALRINFSEHTHFQDQAWETHSHIEPLLGLSEETLRKYIRVVW